MPTGRRVVFFDRPRPRFPEHAFGTCAYGLPCLGLQHGGFVAPGEDHGPAKSPRLVKPKVPRPRGIIQPPGVLVPSFYIDPKTKVYGCYARAWEDILVEELEEKMRGPTPSPKWEDFLEKYAWKQEYLGQFNRGIEPPFSTHYHRRPVNRPSPRIRGKKPAQIIFDSEVSHSHLQANFAQLEMRILTQMTPNDRAVAGLGAMTYTVKKNRTQEGTCKPSPRPLIFQPSLPASPDSEPKDSVTRRLLAGSVLRSPPSTSE